MQKKGTHCGMCRIDFLGNGICLAGRNKDFLAYWRQGRMEIVKQLNSGNVKPTEILKEHVIYPIPKAISKDELVLFRELLQTILGEKI